jgi:hypothetical protein
MATHGGADSAFPYPIIENDIDGDPTPKDQAIYVPSVSAGYARDAIGRAGLRAMPDHLPKNLLNFLDQTNEVFRISHAMASAGQFLDRNTPSMITTRNRKRTRIIGDSGGYQLATGKLKIEHDGDRLGILRWLEYNADIAMTLDWPPGGIGKPGFPFTSTEQCLEATIENLEFFYKHRRPDRGTIFLNVIQGTTPQESVDWYKAVKMFPFEGWAVAGALRNDIYHLCRLIITMHEDGELAGKRWFHVLGTSEPGTAVLLTALQRAVKRHLGHNIRFSFDTSTPFRLLVANQALGLPVFSKDKLGIEQVDAPCGARFIGKQLGWPFSNLVDDSITLADMHVSRPPPNTTQRDTLGNHLLALQNLRALCFAILSANRRFDVELITGKHTVGVKEGRAVAAINAIMQAPNPRKALHQYASLFDNDLRKSYDVTTADADRDFADGYDGS